MEGFTTTEHKMARADQQMFLCIFLAHRGLALSRLDPSRLAYAVMVNNAGSVSPNDVAAGVLEVFNDEGTISNYLYETH